MAIAVVLDFEGATLEQYDKVIELMSLKPGGGGAEGGLFHWVTATDGGIRITDVWESKELFERFAAEKIGPFTQQAGFQGPPKISFYDVHNYLTTPVGAGV
jgi:hypothetical protein